MSAGDETDPLQTVGLQLLENLPHDNRSDSLSPEFGKNGYVLNIGVADAVADRPAHPDDLIPFTSKDETMAPGDNTANEFVVFVGLPGPPSRCLIEANDFA